ncbi:hypothetical protein GCM10023339_05300 [Alloalcanivorax gelatiniphagus]
MTTKIDWQQELDASFGSGDDVPVGHYLAAGRRAVRRRRRAAVVSGLAAAAVVAGVAWGVAPDRGSSSGEAPVATDPSRASAETPSEAPTAGTPTGKAGWDTGEPPARTTPDGLEIRKGAVVHERRDDLYPGKDTESVALDISHDGQRWWMTLEWDDGGATMSAERPEDGLHESFDAFVATAEAGTGMTSVPTDDEAEALNGGLVKWTGGEPVPTRGVTVLRQVPDPVPTAQDSLGLVLERDGVTTWMLLTLEQNGGGASWSEEQDSGWLTFDQWLEDQVALQAGEPGIRLVELGEGSSLAAARPDVEVLERRADPMLPAYGTDGDSPSAVALVEWGGVRWFVLVVRFAGDDAVTTVAASKAGGARTLDEFVAFMADRADEGGMR